MRIVLCGSMTALQEMENIKEELELAKHKVVIPQAVNNELKNGIHAETAKYKIAHNLIRGYYEKIKNSDAVLVVNVGRKGIEGYIGGNAFLEMGFAHVLEKPVYLWQPVPDMPYADEINAMHPVVIYGDLSKIQ